MMDLHTANEFSALMTRAGLGMEETASLLDISARTVRRHIRGETRRINRLRLDRLREIADARCTASPPGTFRFLDLFAGIGGMRRPFEAIGGQCVFTAEWDRFCRETYAANFPEPADSDHVRVGDIRPCAADPARVPPHDVLLAGFPCQPFSIAGVTKKNALGRPHGFLCDTQGTLFHDIARILAWHRPAAFLLENVKNLQRHDRGRTFATIRHVLEDELGYHVQFRVVDSSPWVPQKRERIFIVGFHESNGFRLDRLAIPTGPGPVLGDILEQRVDPKYTLTAHLWDYLKAYKARHRAAGNGFGYSLFGKNDVTRTLSARYHKDGSEILIRQRARRPRRLTPRECARLMGFDPPQGAAFRIPVSDTQAYRQFGNAVVVPVVQAIADLMRPYMMDSQTPRTDHRACPGHADAVSHISLAG